MWIIGRYEATTLFTLKPATATSSGGKTLLVPTPFTIKMALLDAACRIDGVANAELAWDRWLNQIGVALAPARRVVVNNTFIKYLRERRNPAPEGSPDRGYFGRTIAYREHAQIEGEFQLALETEPANADALIRWLINVNYLGRRGGFIQLLESPRLEDTLSDRFIRLDRDIEGFAMGEIHLTQLDDTGEALTFNRANIYSGESIKLGTHRILHHVALPYKRVQSSRGYTYYAIEETNDDER